MRFIPLFLCASLLSSVRVREDDEKKVDEGPRTIHWHESESCQQVKAFAPEPALLKINLDLSKVWSHLPGEALVAMQGIEKMLGNINVILRKSVGQPKIEVSVMPSTVLEGTLLGVKMLLPGVPITSFRNVSFKATSKRSDLPLLSLTAEVVKESNHTFLKFPSASRQVNLAFKKLKVRGNGTYWSGTVSRITNLLSRTGAMNTKAFQQIASALIFRFVANLANEVLPSLLLDLVGSEDHGFLVDLMVKLHVYEDGDPLDPKIDLDVTTQELALETTRQGLTDFVNGAFDGMRELGFADDFEDTRRGLLELAVEENLNMDINASSFATRALYGQDDPDGWGPGLAIKVKMDMNAEVDAWDQEERAAAGVDKEDDEELDNFPQMPFKPWGGECLTGKSWIGATKTCRSFTMSQRNLQNEMDVNDMSFEQSMQLFGSWVHMALKRAFPAFFRVPLAGKILSTDAMWKDSCRYAMMALPSGEWWSPILVAFEILQIHTKGVAELHRIWNGLSFRAAVRQTHYEHPDAGQMIAMSEADGEEGLQIRFAGKWNELLELVPPGILYM